MPTVADLADILWAARPAAGAYVIALTGGVASGKTTLAAGLVEALEARSTRPRVERVGTDGFIFPNAVLIEKGILDRKGFPESFDREALHAALHRIREGATVFPGYSHLTYDIDAGLSRTIDPPDVLIVEGLGLDGAAPVDTLVYLDADETDQEAWFIARFMGFWEVGQHDPEFVLCAVPRPRRRRGRAARRPRVDRDQSSQPARTHRPAPRGGRHRRHKGVGPYDYKHRARATGRGGIWVNHRERAGF